ncbi:protein-glutamate methylesterase/protein-glutamine glutaminase [Haloferula sargassicola]|uniref:protein-glutamate O-methyltransferase n=1 Tax=Haloferula sargassicola TaxID=490096 RepID=A0ABP9UP22_9BACT
MVALAASAGGLDALKSFLSGCEKDGGVAYVVIQHLDPTHESLIADLLQRVTELPVSEVDRMTRLRVDHVHVIPPGKYLEIRGDELHVTAPTEARGPRMAGDHFLRSLAACHGPRAIGCILSGSGSDGSMGAKAIREAGGVILVQSPEEAGSGGMPRSAIDARQADAVMPVGEMPDFIRRYIRGEAGGISNESGDDDRLADILEKVRDHTGYDFSPYKEPTLRRRIHRRMHLKHLDQISDYRALLERDPDEVTALRKDLLISVTHFFRDRGVFAAIEQTLLPSLCAEKEDDTPVRVWVPGVATGEEAYSLAITIYEQLQRRSGGCKVQLFATDVDEAALKQARAAWYPRSIEAEVSPERLRKWFIAERGGYRLKKEIRERVTFARHNLLEDPPYSRIDLVSCRNLMIYLEQEVQQQVAAVFHFALRPEGYLVLGPAEAIAQRSGLFKPIDKKLRIYRRLDVPRQAMRSISRSLFLGGRADFSPPAPERKRLPADVLAEAAQRMLIEHDRLCVVLVDRELSIRYVMGNPAPYLELAEGMVERHIAQFAREGLRGKARMILHHVIEGRDARSETTARLKLPEGEFRVRMLARPADGEAELYACVFECTERISEVAGDPDLQAGEAARARISGLERELTAARHDLNSTIQQLENANEELRASNEEVVSVNEELQSTNEELETSKEELQSVNEELTTINQQLQDKMGEVSRSRDDMANLLASTRIATVFLDRGLCIRRTTEAADRLLHTRPTDAGRELAMFAPVLKDVDLVAEAGRVLESDESFEGEVQTQDGRWFSLQLLPYQNADGCVDGVVITLMSIDRMKRTQGKLERSEDRLRVAIEATRLGTFEYDLSTGEIRSSPRNNEILTGDPGRSTGYLDFVKQLHPEDRAMVEETVAEALRPDGSGEYSVVYRVLRGDGSERWVAAEGRTVFEGEGDGRKAVRMVGTTQDITRQIAARHALEESEQKFRLLADNISQFAWTADATGAIHWYNKRWFDYTGTRLEEMEGWGWKAVHHPDHVARVEARFRKAIETGEDWEDTFPLRSAEGEYRWFLSRAMAIRDASGQVVSWFGTNTDITEQREAELALEEERQRLDERVRERTEQLDRSQQEIRRLHHMAASAEQHERRRIAEGLHDDVQQLLAAARLGLASTMAVTDDDRVLKPLRQAEDWTSKALAATRSLIFDLSPAVLYELGLEPALKHLAEQMKKRFNLDVEVEIGGALDPIEENVRVFVYSSTRELLFNVAKHAGTEAAHLRLARRNQQIHVEVADGGCGFDSEALEEMTGHPGPNGGHVGIKLVRERIRQFGGDMTIRSAPGNGCEVSFWAPVSES